MSELVLSEKEDKLAKIFAQFDNNTTIIKGGAEAEGRTWRQWAIDTGEMTKIKGCIAVSFVTVAGLIKYGGIALLSAQYSKNIFVLLVKLSYLIFGAANIRLGLLAILLFCIVYITRIKTLGLQGGLQQIFNDYENQILNFENYRNKISSEKEIFFENVKNTFLKFI